MCFFQRGDGARDIARGVCASARKILNCALRAHAQYFSRARDVEFMRARKISKKALVNATEVLDGPEDFLTFRRMKSTLIQIFHQNIYKFEVRNCTNCQNVENYVIL